MIIADAQREVRAVYLGGFVGQLVSGAIWLLAAAVGTWSSSRPAILVLVLGGMFIFPITQLVLRVMGRQASLGRDNPLKHLAMQIAFTVPINFLVVAGAALYRLNWFFPACMVVVGAHYLPFIFLYGMKEFAFLAVLLIGAGVVIALLVPGSFALGAWVAGAAFVVFAFVGRSVTLRDEKGSGS